MLSLKCVVEHKKLGAAEQSCVLVNDSIHNKRLKVHKSILLNTVLHTSNTNYVRYKFYECLD